MCRPSGDTTVFMRRLVLVILYGWQSDLQGATCIPDSHPHRITSTKCCINTDVSPDDRHIVARDMYIDKYTKNKLWTKLVLFTRHEILVCCGHKNKIQSRVSNNFFLLLNKLTKLKAENLGTNYFLPMLYKLVNIGSLQNETLPHKTEILTNCTLLCGC